MELWPWFLFKMTVKDILFENVSSFLTEGGSKAKFEGIGGKSVKENEKDNL